MLGLAGLVAMGIASALCQWLTVQALYHASAAAIAPINYTNMLWAIIIGYLWFGDVPTLDVLAGSAHRHGLDRGAVARRSAMRAPGLKRFRGATVRAPA